MDTNTVKEVAQNAKGIVDAITNVILVIWPVVVYIFGHLFTSKKKKTDGTTGK